MEEGLTLEPLGITLDLDLLILEEMEEGQELEMATDLDQVALEEMQEELEQEELEVMLEMQEEQDQVEGQELVPLEVTI